jgi:hypothetical protein
MAFFEIFWATNVPIIISAAYLASRSVSPVLRPIWDRQQSQPRPINNFTRTLGANPRRVDWTRP